MATDPMVAALQGAAPGSLQQAWPPGSIMPVLQSPPPAQVAGDIVNPPLSTFINSGNPIRYDKMLNFGAPSGAAAIKSMGGAKTAPPNVLPISPEVKQKMGTLQPVAGQQVAGDVLPMPGVGGPGAGTLGDLRDAVIQSGQPNSNVKIWPFEPSTPLHWNNIMQQHKILKPTKE